MKPSHNYTTSPLFFLLTLRTIPPNVLEGPFSPILLIAFSLFFVWGPSSCSAGHEFLSAIFCPKNDLSLSSWIPICEKAQFLQFDAKELVFL
ncbi:hypothetical protein H5410_059736 [Solanum commersonii]|uniref:Uncharacterized protein n=1 Tax=Solanum commersonii TaxID=4109 RepID=A0A9J5W3B7_SOLCO|nr:hypothetical protein H5410_059736 [Solanum commersonii]